MTMSGFRVVLAVVALAGWVILAQPSVALTNPACDVTWTGIAADGEWSTGGNWSGAAVPSAADVACVGTGEAVTVSASSEAASVIAEGATITISSGAGAALALADTTGASTVGVLEVQGGSLSNAGALTVAAELSWTAGTIGGPGELTVASTATGAIAPASTIVLAGQQLVNEGALTLSCTQATDPTGMFSLLEGTDGATLINESTMTVDAPGLSESSASAGCQLRRADATAVTLDNRGTLSGNGGGQSGLLQIGWTIANADQASVVGISLSLYGGYDGTAIEGAWDASQIGLEAGGTYELAADVSLDGGRVAVNRSPADAGTATFAQWLSGNSAAPGLEAGAVSWPSATITASGPVRIGDGVSAATVDTIAQFAAPTPFEVELIEPDVMPPSTVAITGSLYVNGGPDDRMTLRGAINAPNGGAAVFGEGTLSIDGSYSFGSWFVNGPDTTLATPGITVEGAVSASDIAYETGATPSLAINFLNVRSGTTTIHADATVSQMNSDDATVVLDASVSTMYLNVYDTTLENSDTFTVQELGIRDGTSTLTGPGTTVVTQYGGLSGRVHQQRVVNNGDLNVYDLLGTGGARIENYGRIFANRTVVTGPPSAVPPQLVNYGSLLGYPDQNGVWWPTRITWEFTNVGTVTEEAYTFDGPEPGPGHGGSSTDYGGSNPSQPQTENVSCGDPIDCATGNQFEQQIDLSIGGLGALSLLRTYNSHYAASQTAPGRFGYGWTSPFDARLEVDPTSGAALVQHGNGSTVRFYRQSSGAFTTDPGVQSTLVSEPGGGYAYELPSRTIMRFSASGRLSEIVNRAGNTTTLSRDGAGRLTTVTAASGRELTFTYNGRGRVASATSPLGLTVDYDYDNADNLVRVSRPRPAGDPSGARWQFDYDSRHQLTGLTDANGGRVTNEYQAGQVVRQTDPAYRVRTWAYEPDRTTVTSPGGSVTRYEFDARNNPVSVTRGYGTAKETTTLAQYNADSAPTQVTDGNGETTQFAYNSAGDRTSQTDPNGDVTQWSYNAAHDITSITLPSGLSTEYTYDTRGLVTGITRSAASSSGPTQTVGLTYDTRGLLTSTTDARGKTTAYGHDAEGDTTSVTDPLGRQSTQAHDVDGRLTSTVSPRGNLPGADPDDHRTSVTYDALGNRETVTDPLGRTTTLGYDPIGNLTGVTNPNGNTTSYAYDAVNQPTQTTRADDTTVSASYDPDGNVATKTNGAGKTTAYDHDVLGQLTATRDPLNRETTYQHDAAGNVIAKQDAAGRTTSYDHDPANRLVGVDYDDPATADETYAYDQDGLRTSMTDATGTTSYGYDGLNRLVSTTNGNGQTVEHAYDAGDNVTAIGYPNGQTVTQAYDDAGQLVSVTDWLSNTTSFAYDADGRHASTTFPSGTGNVDIYDRDRAGQLMGIATAQGATTQTELDYDRDANGLLTDETQTGLPGPASTDYDYTALDQLSQAGADDYDYDAADNITRLDGVTGYAYDDANQLTTSPTETFEHNQLGERTARLTGGSTETTYAYDQAGRLTGVDPAGGAASSYAYAGDGLRATKTVGSVTNEFAWDRTTAIPQLLTDGQTSYLYGPTGLVFAQITSTGTPSYLHHDQLGSVRSITDATGTVTGTFSYTPFGEPKTSTGTTSTPFGYAGQYTDAETGLQYLRARYYDPATAQFLTIDPLVAQTGSPYGYADNNPTNLVDPLGLFGIPSLSDIDGALSDAGMAVSNAAAGTLDGLTMGASTKIAGSIFGFDPNCADFGTAGDIGDAASNFFGGGFRIAAGAAGGAMRAAASLGKRGADNAFAGARYPLSPKVQGQLGGRGWTTEAIDESVRSGQQVRAINKATGNPATRYIHPTTGQSVVIDDMTAQVIHVGGPGFLYGPGSGDLP